MTETRPIASLEEAATKANELYTARRYADAEALCRQILKHHADQFHALYLSGLVAHRLGNQRVANEKHDRLVPVHRLVLVYVGVRFDLRVIVMADSDGGEVGIGPGYAEDFKRISLAALEQIASEQHPQPRAPALGVGNDESVDRGKREKLPKPGLPDGQPRLLSSLA